MTDQLEAIDDATKVRHKIDNTLARFSAAHDEMNAEEAKRKERFERLTARPAALLEQTRTALQRVVAPTESGPAKQSDEEPERAPQTRLQEKKQRRSQRSVLIGRIAIAVVAGLIFLAIGAAWAYT
jgi:hypothetical protein